MCLSIPGKIISRTEGMGKVEFGEISKEINLTLVPEAKVDDYVLVHAGIAISKIKEDEAERIFSYLEEINEIH